MPRVFENAEGMPQAGLYPAAGPDINDHWAHGETLSKRRPTLFQAGTGTDAWRQVLTAWLKSGVAVCDPCCGSGQVLVGATAAGMRPVGLDADAANVEATRTALEAAAQQSANAAAGVVR